MSNIKFETINDQLYRMVEPEPLTEKSQFPCVVKLIGGFDTPIGRYNNMAVWCSRDFDPIIAIGFGCVKFHWPRYEIIGYPVTAHSAEWALYQMMQGKWVVCDGLHPPCHLHANMVTWMVSEFPARWEVQSPDKWVLYCVANTGWQLYEPKPAKEPIADCDNCKHVCTNSNIDHCHMYEPRPAYKVGDYVRGKSGYDYLIISSPSKILWSNPDIYDAIPVSCMDSLCLETSDIERKLSPSEVVVHIGCLSGTVRQCGDEEEGVFALHAKNNAAVIPFAMLDEPTLTLVNELLEKQKGDDK